MFIEGPSVQTFLKRTYHSATESSSDEAETSKDEDKKGRRRISLQPKKLFKTHDAATPRGWSWTDSAKFENNVTNSSFDNEIECP